MTAQNEVTPRGAGSPSPAPVKSSWKKTVVTLAVIGALTILALRDPQYAGEAVVAFLGLVGIHSQTQT